MEEDIFYSETDAMQIGTDEVLGISPLVNLTIVIEGVEIKHYKNFQLLQSATEHHKFTLVLDHDSLGSPEDHQMEQVQEFMGKRILVIFSYKNFPSNSPERDFIGVITKVGYSKDSSNHAYIVLEGSSPTVLLDAAPHIQSFGGTEPIALGTVAQELLKEGLDGKYTFRVDPNFTDNLTYSCQYNETHYNYLARMAETYGEQFFYDGNKIHFGKLPSAENAVTLIFGKDVEDIEVEMKAKHLKRVMYGYNSSSNELLSTSPTKVDHESSLAKAASTISEKTFRTPSLSIAPLKAITSKTVEYAQKSTTASEAVNVFITKGKTKFPFLYPGCLVDMYMRNPENSDNSYLTRLMITNVNHTVNALGNYNGSFEAIAAGTGYLPSPVFETPIAQPQIGTVTQNKDDKGRVQVKFDWQTGGTTTEWIRVMTPDAGNSELVKVNRGFVAIPEIGDQVMVGFVLNHPDRPYVMGSMFHGQSGVGGGKGNSVKSFSSKSGHTIEFDDYAGVLIIDKTLQNSVYIDGNDKITVTSAQKIELTNGKSSILLDDDRIAIYADKVEISNGEYLSSKIDLAAVQTNVSGQTELNLSSDAKIDIASGSLIQLDSGAAVTTNAQITTISSTGITSVQGASVKLN